jgi:hypothetical protein
MERSLRPKSSSIKIQKSQFFVVGFSNSTLLPHSTLMKVTHCTNDVLSIYISVLTIVLLAHKKVHREGQVGIRNAVSRRTGGYVACLQLDTNRRSAQSNHYKVSASGMEFICKTVTDTTIQTDTVRKCNWL